MKDFLSIKEFSRLSGIETTTLRYWDEIGLFSPERRDPKNDYRYYSPWQIIAVNFVTVLRNLGIPLRKISEVESTRSPESIMDLIEQQEYLLDKEMRKLQDAYSVIHTRRELIKRGQRTDISEIGVIKLPSRALILGPPNDSFAGSKSFYKPFVNFCDHADDLRVNLDYPIGGYHQTMDSFLASPSEPERFFSLDPNGNNELEAGEYLVAYALGYYGEFGDLPERLAAYIQEHELEATGPVYVIYLHDEISAKDPVSYLSQVSVKVAPAT